ncbi:two-component sensor histidine kinase [Insulibacter thermoxylanivorax]|uniref:histidine kinase n=1 Tax=Insulibacter thermoxylanivorax TaxID=2749268 RepID=A0A916VGJ8_9BACL|nr:HAMP domain-containing sensor histidine kinase [Insulibacter thermoxylanivorax]GFR38601.1 two-component sensor histidine kinase [Insulibacter thermoxylanivorax]
MPIRLKLALWYGGVLAVIMTVFSGTLYFLMYNSIQHQYRSSLQEQTEKVYDRLEYTVRLSLRGWNIDVRLDAQDMFFTENIYLQLINISNRRISMSTNAVEDGVMIPVITENILQHLLTESPYVYTNAEINGLPFIVYNRGIYNNSNQLIGVLQGATYSGHMISLLEELRFVLILSSIAIIIASSSFGWFLSRKALRPIDAVINAANQIESGEDLSKRIPYKGPQDEIGRLIQTINGMLERIQHVYQSMEEAYRRQRRFVSDASHELRTPLTTIRGNVELVEKMWQREEDGEQPISEEVMTLSREAFEDISAETERMSRLVNDLLSLARADAGKVIERVPLPLLPIVEEVVRRAQFLPRSPDVAWRAEDLSPFHDVFVCGNRDYLQQLLFIFIENAFKYTEKGEVVLQVQKTDEQAGIRISDTGIGMDKEEVPMIFERFYRADPSRGKVGGTGLGLSIAKWILDEHEGSVEVYTRKDQGSTFIIWLPIWKGRDNLAEEE